MLSILNNISNNYYKACLAAYFYDINNFDKYFGLLNVPVEEEITFYICKGVRENLEFAKHINSLKNINFNDFIYSSISASFITHNFLDDNIIKNYIPANIWYPKIPNKQTCLELLNIDYKYNYIVGILSILNNWEDIYNKCKIKKIDNTLYLCMKYFKNVNINKDKKEIISYFDSKDYLVKECKLKNINDRGRLNLFNLLFDGYLSIYPHLEENIEDCIMFNEDYDLDIIDTFSFNNLGYLNDTSFSLEYNIIKHIDNVPFKDLKIEDIRYNFYNSLIVLKNKDRCNNNFKKEAITNYIINNVYDKDLIIECNPFYFYSYRLPHLDILIKILEELPQYKYNIYLVFSILNHDYLIDKYNILPDVDLISYAYRSNSLEFYNKLLNKSKELNKYYKHLDFENEIVYQEPKVFDLNYNIVKSGNHPLFRTS